MSNVDLKMTRGDTYPVSIAVTNPDNTVRDISNGSLVITAKHGYSDLDINAVFQITQASGAIVDPTHGKTVITIPKTATAALPNFSVLVYDVELTEQTGNVTTIQSGKLFVNADVSLA